MNYQKNGEKIINLNGWVFNNNIKRGNIICSKFYDNSDIYSPCMIWIYNHNIKKYELYIKKYESNTKNNGDIIKNVDTIHQLFEYCMSNEKLKIKSKL